ncbi:MAG: DUF1800 domain-containing protein [Bacteroidota bacterium]|nr:DUF1800 domain-containing protein [Candidatus Kapabacteria bacterium]MDW8220624.1 DUF1800 domain-containing protein [Bacteroidota bacterium]
MHRRDFFSFFYSSCSERYTSSECATSTEHPHIAADITPQQHAKEHALQQNTLEPYAQPLDYRRALHLVRRLSFAAPYSLVQQLVGKTAQEAVDIVLGTSATTPQPQSTPGAWIHDITENPEKADRDTRNEIYSRWYTQFASLQSWWVNLMLREAFPAREKLVLFWSGHFTSEFAFDDMYNPPQLLFRQNQTLRKHCVGDMRQLTEDITLDGAMLNYLGGTLNTKGSPNENYARELLELFTTGLAAYTEGDIKEAARTLTGWRASRFNDEPRPNGNYITYFVPSAHDTGAKQFLGVTIPAREADANTELLVRSGEVRRLIDIIFEQRPQEVSRFLCTKLYRFFVYANPSVRADAVIAQMAVVFRRSNYHILPVLRALCASAHFFDESVIGVQIKTPAEFVIGLARQLDANPSQAVRTMNALEQVLMDPPTVAGWESYRSWISTTTYPLRVQYAQELIRNISNEHVTMWARQFPNAESARALVNSIGEFLFPKPLSQSRLQGYLSTLLSGAPEYEWASIMRDTHAAGTRIKFLLARMAQAPDIQLC